MFYTIPTARVFFPVQISLDIFSLRQEHFWTSVLGDCICEMKRVTESGQQGMQTQDHFAVL